MRAGLGRKIFISLNLVRVTMSCNNLSVLVHRPGPGHMWQCDKREGAAPTHPWQPHYTCAHSMTNYASSINILENSSLRFANYSTYRLFLQSTIFHCTLHSLFREAWSLSPPSSALYVTESRVRVVPPIIMTTMPRQSVECTTCLIQRFMWHLYIL